MSYIVLFSTFFSRRESNTSIYFMFYSQFFQGMRQTKRISVAHYPVNRGKNRYFDVLPCEVLYLCL
jgi:hypothetical protein